MIDEQNRGPFTSGAHRKHDARRRAADHDNITGDGFVHGTHR